MRVDRQLNLSVTDQVADEIFTLVRPEIPDSTNVNTNASLIYSAEVEGVSYCLERGVSAWFNYVPSMSCVLGRLNGCTDNGIENGTIVQACGVQVREGTLDDEVPILGPGWINIVREPAGQSEGPPTNATDGRREVNGAICATGFVKEKMLGVFVLSCFLGLVMVS